MTLNTFSAGVNTSFSTELNQNFKGNSIVAVDTSSNLSMSVSTATTIVNSSTLSIASSDIQTADYLKVCVNGNFNVIASSSSDGDSASASISMKVVDSLSSDTVINATAVQVSVSTTSTDRRSERERLQEFAFYVPVTADYRSNGMSLDVYLTGSVAESGGSGTATYSNRAVVVESKSSTV